MSERKKRIKIARQQQSLFMLFREEIKWENSSFNGIIIIITENSIAKKHTMKFQVKILLWVFFPLPLVFENKPRNNDENECKCKKKLSVMWMKFSRMNKVQKTKQAKFVTKLPRTSTSIQFICYIFCLQRMPE